MIIRGPADVRAWVGVFWGAFSTVESSSSFLSASAAMEGQTEVDMSAWGVAEREDGEMWGSFDRSDRR